jgi:hypothetical protein
MWWGSLWVPRGSVLAGLSSIRFNCNGQTTRPRLVVCVALDKRANICYAWVDRTSLYMWERGRGSTSHWRHRRLNARGGGPPRIERCAPWSGGYKGELLSLVQCACRQRKRSHLCARGHVAIRVAIQQTKQRKSVRRLSLRDKDRTEIGRFHHFWTSVLRVRDREAPGSNPGPPTIFVFEIGDFCGPLESAEHSWITISRGATESGRVTGSFVY